MSRLAVWLNTMAALAPLAWGDAFLGRVSKEVIEQAFQLDWSDADKAVTFEDELRPTYETLPKNEQGQLDPSTVRYALHRYFVHKHNWYVKGLDPQGAGLGNSSSTFTSDFVPAHILKFLEQKVQGRGLVLKELAVFAATLSDLIFQEGFGSLWEVYRKLELPLEASVSGDDFDRAVRAHFSELVIGEWFSFESKGDFAKLEETAREFLPRYDSIMMWAADLRRARDFADRSSRNPFVEQVITWERAADHLREFMHNFGSLTKDECRGLKEQLMDMEVAGTGRVMLSDFYSNRMLQHESVAYLRNQATLEEERATRPRIIIPNYITAVSRCTPFSSYFSICCQDQCEGLLASLERSIGTPTSTPARIAKEVSMLSSDSKSAPWELSAELLSRLQEIASHHQGQVPLHGRLFMQWLHHAFPAECAFPHVSGTTRPVSQDDWLNVQDGEIEDVLALASEKAKFVQDQADANSTVVELPWMAVEELVAVDKPTRSSRKPQTFQHVLRFAMGIGAVVSFALALMRLSSALLSSDTEKAAHLV